MKKKARTLYVLIPCYGISMVIGHFDKKQAREYKSQKPCEACKIVAFKEVIKK